MKSGTGALGQLSDAQEEFERCWLRTGTVWDDAVRRAFEREHLDPILKQIVATRTELEQLLQIVARARRSVH
ncbi:MAG TPA: hypothetical protein VHA53_06105 [Nitrolancea sp.]|jgi:hypothetical protein|nr:hypothetical protein [Nitrolancea sp.]